LIIFPLLRTRTKKSSLYRKIRMLIITGQLRSIKDGRSRRILPEWVEAYVQDHAKSTEDMW